MEHFLMCTFNANTRKIYCVYMQYNIGSSKICSCRKCIWTPVWKWNHREYFWKISTFIIGMYCCMLVLYCYIYICEQLYWYVTSHKWVPVFMTSNTVKYNKIYKIIFAFVLQCPKWSSEKCGVCKSFHAWADKKVSTVLLIQCDYKGLLHLN